MKKLITMTAFIQSKYVDQIDSGTQEDKPGIVLRKIFRYLNLIHQPLYLSQFIPCNEKEEPMEKPNGFEQWSIYGAEPQSNKILKSYQEYQKVLDKVLFEGWAVDKEHSTQITNGKQLLSQYDDCWDKTIEDLINSGIELTPTEACRKLIGL